MRKSMNKSELTQITADILEAFNAHDEARMRAYYADDAVFQAPGDVRLQGPAAPVPYVMAWLSAFPDAHIVLHNRIVGDDWVAEEFTFEGTHQAPMASPTGMIPATHRRLSARGIQVFRFVNGKVAAENLYFDQVQVLTQLGLMPTPAQAPAASTSTIAAASA
jgi:steroid delta-isomerase-like uncharacterized protein